VEIIEKEKEKSMKHPWLAFQYIKSIRSPRPAPAVAIGRGFWARLFGF
jgi:hypothetical protein